MNTLIRWSPFGELVDWRHQVERLMDEVVSIPAIGVQEREGWSFAVDLSEQPSCFVVKASVPGIKPEDLDVTLEENVLTIRGRAQSDETAGNGQYHWRRQSVGRYLRRLTLPAAVKAERAEAVYENGVLTLTLPKASETKVKRISITPKHSKSLVERVKAKLPRLKSS